MTPRSSMRRGMQLFAAVVTGAAACPVVLAGQPPVSRAEFVQLATKDSLTLSGMYLTPSRRPRQTAIVIASGSGGEFYDYSGWAEAFVAAGYPVVVLNRRDHGESFGYEPFEASALDMRYAIDVAVQHGAVDVVLVGHSYGTTVVPYYAAVTRDRRVRALVLLAPLADLRAATVRMLGRATYDSVVRVARDEVAAGRGGETYAMQSPAGPGAGPPLMHSYETFLNKRGPDSKAVPAELIRSLADLPILAIRDPADPLPGTVPPAQQQLQAASARLEYVLLPDIRAGKMDVDAHGFVGRVGEVMAIVLPWLEKHGF